MINTTKTVFLLQHFQDLYKAYTSDPAAVYMVASSTKSQQVGYTMSPSL